MIKTKRMRWAGHVAHVEEKIYTYKVLAIKLFTVATWNNQVKMEGQY
jgi:hypothetical protein